MPSHIFNNGNKAVIEVTKRTTRNCYINEQYRVTSQQVLSDTDWKELRQAGYFVSGQDTASGVTLEGNNDGNFVYSCYSTLDSGD
jgi:hypothetical protein